MTEYKEIDNAVSSTISQVSDDTMNPEQLAYYGIIMSGTESDGIYNEYDPKVWHDPLYVKPIIVMPYDNSEDSSKGLSTHNLQEDTDAIYGKFVPIIQIANTVIKDEDLIRAFELDYTGFVPTLRLDIYDDKESNAAVYGKPHKIDIQDTIKVILVPQDEKTYRTIKLEFNITNQQTIEIENNDFYQNVYHYDGSFKLKELTDDAYTENIDYYTCNLCNVNGLNVDENTPTYATNYDNAETTDTNQLLNQINNSNIINDDIDSLLESCVTEYKKTKNINAIISLLINSKMVYNETDDNDANIDDTAVFVDKLMKKYPDYVDKNTDITDCIDKAITYFKQYKKQVNNDNISDTHTTTTWQALHAISEQCNLGFAGNDSVKEIKDMQKRRIANQHFSDYITNNILQSSGNMLDTVNAWIDVYGYLVVMNEGKILNSTNIDISKLKVIASIGFNQTGQSQSGFHSHPVLVDRVLTNFRQTGCLSNIEIDSWYEDTSFNAFETYGTQTTVFVCDDKTNGGNGSYQQYDLNVVMSANDNSIGSNKARNISGDSIHIYSPSNAYGYNYEMQKIINNFASAKKSAKHYICRLVRPNFGLQRGTLIGVSLWVDDRTSKMYIAKNMNELATEDTKTDDIIQRIVNTEGSQMPDIENSGIYYIDGMWFKYDEESKEINQYLSLILQSPRINLSNAITSARATYVEKILTGNDTDNKQSVSSQENDEDNFVNPSNDSIIESTGLI